MPIEYYIDLVRFADLMIIALIIMLFIKNWNRDQNVKIGIFYLISIICYLLISWELIRHSGWKRIIQSGAYSVPVLFWYFSKSIFDDSYKINKNHLLFYLGVIFIQNLLYYYNYILDGKNANIWFTPILSSTSQIISLTFIILGIAEAYRGKFQDLLESRLRFRTIFIFTTGFLILLTLIAEISVSQRESGLYLSLLQKISIGVILFTFFYFLVEFKSGFFFEKRKSQEPKADADPKISQSFNRLISQEKIYLQEGLTIRRLSEQMNEQEYKVRRYINQHLDFRNFNDFLNSYRVQDACEILLDETKSDQTILEIAYSLGYSSLGPFNKAFKDHTGTTPTAYRKQT